MMSEPSPPVIPTVAYATPMGYGEPLKPNRAATISLVCGVLFFFFFAIEILLGRIDLSRTNVSPALLFALGIAVCFTPLLALIIGIVGVRRMRRGNYAGKARAVFGISIGGIGIFIVILSVLGVSPIPSNGYGHRETRNRVKCSANLKQIGLAMQLYANENKGLYPPRPEDLILTQDITSDEFICPSTSDTASLCSTPQQQAANLSTGGHRSYIYLGAGKNSSASANVVLVYELLRNHGQGMNVLFGDGHAEFISFPIAKQVQAELQAGKNPPPSYRGF